MMYEVFEEEEEEKTLMLEAFWRPRWPNSPQSLYHQHFYSLLTIYEAAALSPNVKMQQWAQDNLKARDEMEWLLLNELKQMTL